MQKEKVCKQLDFSSTNLENQSSKTGSPVACEKMIGDLEIKELFSPNSMLFKKRPISENRSESRKTPCINHLCESELEEIFDSCPDMTVECSRHEVNNPVSLLLDRDSTDL